MEYCSDGSTGLMTGDLTEHKMVARMGYLMVVSSGRVMTVLVIRSGISKAPREY